PDGALLVTAPGVGDGTARVWDVASGAELAGLAHDGAVLAAAFSSDGMRVVTASRDKTARVWDASSGVELARLAHDGPVSCALFSSDGERVVTVSDDWTVRVCDASSGVELARVREKFNDITFSPDGACAVTTAGAVAQVWDLARGAK